MTDDQIFLANGYLNPPTRRINQLGSHLFKKYFFFFFGFKNTFKKFWYFFKKIFYKNKKKGK